MGYPSVSGMQGGHLRGRCPADLIRAGEPLECSNRATVALLSSFRGCQSTGKLNGHGSRIDHRVFLDFIHMTDPGPLAEIDGHLNVSGQRAFDQNDESPVSTPAQARK